MPGVSLIDGRGRLVQKMGGLKGIGGAREGMGGRGEYLDLEPSFLRYLWFILAISWDTWGYMDLVFYVHS